MRIKKIVFGSILVLSVLLLSAKTNSVSAETCVGRCIFAESCSSVPYMEPAQGTCDLANQVCCQNQGDSCTGTCMREACSTVPQMTGAVGTCPSGYYCCQAIYSEEIEATNPITRQTLFELNPLAQESEIHHELSTPGGILSRFLGRYAFPIAGLILFVMLVWGGFEMLAGAATKKSLDAGKQRVTAALIGFLLLFASYWIAQIMEVVFDINIL